jgi:hypothetical protein
LASGGYGAPSVEAIVVSEGYEARRRHKRVHTVTVANLVDFLPWFQFLESDVGQHGRPLLARKLWFYLPFLPSAKTPSSFAIFPVISTIFIAISRLTCPWEPDGIDESQGMRSERYRQKHRQMFPLGVDPWRLTPRSILLILRDLLADQRMSANVAGAYCIIWRSAIRV